MGQGRRQIKGPVAVTVARSGGVAGLRTQASLSEGDMTAADAVRLRELVAALEPAAPDRGTQRPGADRFSYDIAVRIGPEERTMSGSEGGLAPGWRALVSFVMTHARRQPQPPDR